VNVAFKVKLKLTVFDTLSSFSMPKLKFLASTVPEILMGAKIPEVGHVTPT